MTSSTSDTPEPRLSCGQGFEYCKQAGYCSGHRTGDTPEQDNMNQYICRGVHCKCMNLDRTCKNWHSNDHACPMNKVTDKVEQTEHRRNAEPVESKPPRAEQELEDILKDPNSIELNEYPLPQDLKDKGFTGKTIAVLSPEAKKQLLAWRSKSVLEAEERVWREVIDIPQDINAQVYATGKVAEMRHGA